MQILDILRQGVIWALQDGLGVSVYGEEIFQGQQENCITISIKDVSRKPLLGSRQEESVVFDIVFHPFGEAFPLGSLQDVASGMYEALRQVSWDGECFLARRMEHVINDGRLFFTAGYLFHGYFTEDVELMTTLEQKRKGDVFDGGERSGTAEIFGEVQAKI